MVKGPHVRYRLSAIALRTLPDGWHCDGHNLYLFVRGNSRSWVLRYVGLDRKRRNMGLGTLDTVSLAEARKLAFALREQLRHPTNPIDPSLDRRAKRKQMETEQARQMTFKQCADAYLSVASREWRNQKHASQWRNTLDTYVHPVIGDIPVADVDKALVLKVLRPIWEQKTETARRVRGRIELILNWATAEGLREGKNPAVWRDSLKGSLPNLSKVKKPIHRPALPYSRMTEFMTALRSRDGMAAKALEFLILTATRSGETRGARWSEIDLATGVWTLPAERMKMLREHRVPLSDAAIELLKSLTRIDGEDLVFPSSKADTPLSDMTLTALLRRMEYADVTVHGFRSTFRDWAAEVSHYPADMAEMALAHAVGDKVEAAYRRGDMLQKRFSMMNDWAEFCEIPEETCA